MTKFSQIIEDEKIEYANQKVQENSIKERNTMALKMFDEGIGFTKVMKITGFTESELLKLQNETVSY